MHCSVGGQGRGALEHKNVAERTVKVGERSKEGARDWDIQKSKAGGQRVKKKGRFCGKKRKFREERGVTEGRLQTG